MMSVVMLIKCKINFYIQLTNNFAYGFSDP